MNKKPIIAALITAGLYFTCPQTIEAIDNGAYKIKPTAKTSLIVENSSFNVESEVLEWTETNVASQQWYIEQNTEGTYYIRNVYTGMYLSYRRGKLIQRPYSTASKWEITEGEGNTYTLTTGSKSYTSYTLEAVTAPQAQFTSAMQKRVMDGFTKKFLQNKGGSYQTFINGGWGEAETLEVILDAYETTGNEAYKTIFNNCYSYFKYHVGSNWNGGTVIGGYDWFGDNFNDDVMWMIIAAARAANLISKRTHLMDAANNFDLIWDRAWLGYIDMLRWAERDGNRNGTNSCINGPAEVAACYIAEAYASGDNMVKANEYWDKAKRLYDNQRKYLADVSTGHVYDSVVLDPETGKVVKTGNWASTYNQGTMLGAATLLYKHFGDAYLKADAQKIYEYTVKNMTDGQRVIKQCEGLENGDLQGFKGILMRYIRNYYEVFGDDDARDVLARNAFHVFNNMNSKDYGLTNWRIKAPEDFIYDNTDYSTKPFSAGTVVSAAFNTIIPEATLTPYAYYDGAWHQQSTITTVMGDEFKLKMEADGEGTWTWTGPDRFFSTEQEIDLGVLDAKKYGVYAATFTSTDGKKSTASIRIVNPGPTITPYLMTDKGVNWTSTTSISVTSGTKITFGPQPTDAAYKWTWKGPNNFTYTGREPSVTVRTKDYAGIYTATCTDANGYSSTVDFYITVDGYSDVQNVNAEVSNKVKGIYDLQGRKVEKPSKGLYIVDGKKVVISK